MEVGIIAFVLILLAVLYSLYNKDEPKTDLNKVIEEVFGIDLRSLAFFRVCLGLILILDLFARSLDIEAFYTDAGAIPRFVAIRLLTPSEFSFFFISGNKEIIFFLFFINFLFLLLFLFGYKTRLATIMCLLFFISHDYRNPYIQLDGGDSYIRAILFWSIFLPLGAFYSIDSALNTSSTNIPKRYFSMATFAYYAQVAILYWFSVIHKLRQPHWASGKSLFFQTQTFPYGAELGIKFAQTLPKGILEFLNHFVLNYEIWGPILLISPILNPQAKILAILGFTIMHIGFGLTMDLGYFSHICIIAVVPFIPTLLWEKILPKLKNENRINLKIYYDNECNFCKKLVLIFKVFFLVPETNIIPAQSNEELNSEMIEKNSWIVIDSKGNKHFKFNAFIKLCKDSPLLFIFVPFLSLSPINNFGNYLYEKIAENRRKASIITSFLAFKPMKISTSEVQNLIVLFFIAYVFVWNLSTISSKYKVPDKLRWIMSVTGLKQAWNMATGINTGWFIFPSTLKDGTESDLFYEQGNKVSWDKPKLPSATYKNIIWKLYLNTLFSGYADFTNLNAFGAYLCKRWNDKHQGDKEVKKISFYYMKVDALLETYTYKEPQKKFFGTHYCTDKELPHINDLEVIEKEFGENKNLLISELWKIASKYTQQKKHIEADYFYNRLLELEKEVYGEKHPAIYRLLKYLLSLYTNQNEQDKVDEIRKQIDDFKRQN